METFLVYGGKSGLLLLLFWAVYRLCLSGETFYRFNRFFLLAGLGVALLLPLAPVQYTVEVPVSGTSPVYGYGSSRAGEEDSSGVSATDISLSLYACAVVLFLLFRGYGLWRLWRKVRRYGYRSFDGYRLVESEAFRRPFSCWRYIFLPGSGLSVREREMVVQHEAAHIGQRHWADLWLADGFCLLWWVNPIAWLYKRSICENHEYLADRAVLSRYTMAEYQCALVNGWLKAPVFAVAHSFCHSKPMRRLAMMKKSGARPAKKGLALLAVPGICFFIWVFAEPRYVAVPVEPAAPFIEQYGGLPVKSETAVTVVNEECKPLTGAQVIWTATKRSDREGRVRLPRVPGKQTLEISAVGYDPVVLESGTTGESENERMTVGLRKRPETIHFILSKSEGQESRPEEEPEIIAYGAARRKSRMDTVTVGLVTWMQNAHSRAERDTMIVRRLSETGSLVGTSDMNRTTGSDDTTHSVSSKEFGTVLRSDLSSIRIPKQGALEKPMDGESEIVFSFKKGFEADSPDQGIILFW